MSHSIYYFYGLASVAFGALAGTAFDQDVVRVGSTILFVVGSAGCPHNRPIKFLHHSAFSLLMQ